MLNDIINPFIEKINTENKQILMPFFGETEKGSSCITNVHSISPNFTKHRHQGALKTLFKNLCKKKIAEQDNFMSDKSLVNEKIWYMKKIKKDIRREYRDNYIKTLMIWKHIERETQKDGLVPVFFTATVEGDLHPFSANSSIRKENWNIENLPEAYKILQALHKEIRQQCARTLKYSPKFIRAVEYHKSFMPHSHIVYFVRNEDIEPFQEILKNKIKINTNIGRTDTQVLEAYDPENGRSAVAYLLKYLKKNVETLTDINATDHEDLEIFHGWKLFIGAKQLYSQSKIEVPKWVLKRVSWHFKNWAERGYSSMIDDIIDNVDIITESQKLDGEIVHKVLNKAIEFEPYTFGSYTFSPPKTKIYRKTEHYKIPNRSTEKIGVKVVDLIVWRNDEEVYNKRDWELIYDWELSRYKSNLYEIDIFNQINQYHIISHYAVNRPIIGHTNNFDFEGKTYEYHFVDSG